jgi:hypothetical protein
MVYAVASCRDEVQSAMNNTFFPDWQARLAANSVVNSE